MSYEKNSVKLLPKIDNFENNTVLYTELDGNFSVGDKLYIMVMDSSSSEYSILDSLQKTGFTYRSVGYELLSKNGNKLVLNIDYTLVTSGLTITSNNCYIGRVYIRNGSILKGTINGSLMYNMQLTPPSNLDITWLQGIIGTSPSPLTNINFKDKNTSKLIMKSEVSADGTINSYYTIDNYNIGLSIINIPFFLPNTMTLNKCNITSGVFNSCNVIDGNYINDGELNNCTISGVLYNTINGATFNDCILSTSLLVWLDGTWNSSWSGGTSNPFYNGLIWSGGTWANGIFPSNSVWYDGRFKKGEFYGIRWYNGSFGTINSIDIGPEIDTIFSATTWYDGRFNGGVFKGSDWHNGEFNNGKFCDSSIWREGVFNGGSFSGSSWSGGTFNSGVFVDSTWSGGTFNNGNIRASYWYNGVFNNGILSSGTTWYNGNFYGGKFSDSTWAD